MDGLRGELNGLVKKRCGFRGKVTWNIKSPPKRLKTTKGKVSHFNLLDTI